MSKVILISPPYMELSYPSYDIPIALTKGCNYMNPGLLICSSILDSKNIPNKIVKIYDLTNEENIDMHIDDDTILVGISCTCSWEYLESLKIAEVIKKQHPNIKVIMSGWQIKSIKEKVFEDSNDIDYIILGDAEYTIEQLYNNIKSKQDKSIPSVVSKNSTNNKSKYPNIEFPVIGFSKFPNYLDYVPYVEESRNCPYSCSFCLNSCVQDRYQIVPFEIFKKNVENLEKQYGETANANLLAANFGVNNKATKEKLDYLKTKSLNWNIELHIDNCWEEYIDDLKEAGINKVSIGFESGSPRILKLMNKTKDPERYLSRLKELLYKLNKYDIKPSLNLLFDYREDYETINETLHFLEENKELIKKVKANFMFVFEGLLNTIDFSYNPNIIADEYGKIIHAYPILPKDMTLKEISYIINEIEAGNYNIATLNDVKVRKR